MASSSPNSTADMEVIGMTATVPNFGWAILLGLVGIGALIVSGVLTSEENTDPVKIVLGIFGILMVGFALVTGATSQRETDDTALWVSKVKAAVEERYGIELTRVDVLELEFPTERPDDDFVEYGTISETRKPNGAIDRRDITLVWDGDRLLLAGSVDGEEFTELDR